MLSSLALLLLATYVVLFIVIQKLVPGRNV